jgi:hypothetical protein
MQNKANSSIADCRLGRDPQRDGRFCQTKPILAWCLCLRRAKCAKQTQFTPGQPAGLPPGPVVQTKPIPAAGEEEASAQREGSYGESYSLQAAAKQSQFRRAGHARRNYQRSCRWGTMRQTKPIRRQVVAGKDVMVNRSARRFRRSEPTLLGSNARNEPNLEGLSCKTKPIRGANRAKRTQFPTAPEDGAWGTWATGQSRRMPFWWSQCFRSPISLKISLS